MKGHTSDRVLAACLASLHRSAAERESEDYFRGRMDALCEVAILMDVTTHFERMIGGPTPTVTTTYKVPHGCASPYPAPVFTDYVAAKARYDAEANSPHYLGGMTPASLLKVTTVIQTLEKNR